MRRKMPISRRVGREGFAAVSAARRRCANRFAAHRTEPGGPVDFVRGRLMLARLSVGFLRALGFENIRRIAALRNRQWLGTLGATRAAPGFVVAGLKPFAATRAMKCNRHTEATCRCEKSQLRQRIRTMPERSPSRFARKPPYHRPPHPATGRFVQSKTMTAPPKRLPAALRE